MKNILVLLILTTFSGCATISSSLTPIEIKNTVSKAASISRASITDPPDGENLKQYLIINAELWQQLEIFYGLKQQ